MNVPDAVCLNIAERPFSRIQEANLLVTNKVLLDKAKAGSYAVGAFNINNLEFGQAITSAAAELESPAILAVSQGAIKYAGFENLVSMVRTVSDNMIPAHVPIDIPPIPAPIGENAILSIGSVSANSNEFIVELLNTLSLVRCLSLSRKRGFMS